MLFNSGLASHGGGENRGLSKSLAMVVTLVICPSHYGDEIDWRLAWTPINILNFQDHFRPILYSLAEALDYHYWVSKSLTNGHSLIFRIFIMVWNPMSSLLSSHFCRFATLWILVVFYYAMSINSSVKSAIYCLLQLAMILTTDYCMQHYVHYQQIEQKPTV